MAPEKPSWQSLVHLGPGGKGSNARGVRTVGKDNRKRWASAAKAARYLGVTPQAVIKSINRGGSCAGIRLTWQGSTAQIKRLKPKLRRHVTCVETGEVWSSVWVLANRNHRVEMSIRRAIDKGTKWEGRTYIYGKFNSAKRLELRPNGVGNAHRRGH